MLNYLHFGEEEVIKTEVQPGGTDALYSCAPAQLGLTFLSKLSGLIICEIVFSHIVEGFGDSENSILT